MSRILLADLAVDELPGDLLAVPVVTGQCPPEGAAAWIDWRLCGALAAEMAAGRFSALPQQRLVLPSRDRLRAPWVLFVGISPVSAEAAGSGIARAVESMTQACLAAGYGHFSLALPQDWEADMAGIVGAIEQARDALGQQEIDCHIGFAPAAGGVPTDATAYLPTTHATARGKECAV